MWPADCQVFKVGKASEMMTKIIAVFKVTQACCRSCVLHWVVFAYRQHKSLIKPALHSSSNASSKQFSEQPNCAVFVLRKQYMRHSNMTRYRSETFFTPDS